ncbi:MAG: histidinol-phosphatase HisJ family protein, partial [Acidobacteria bacterium]|nr:histidinol-phosphatase HisJ family protein [Acidobacteriota bacterium]
TKELTKREAFHVQSSPMTTNPPDYHVHSRFSADSRASMADACTVAVAKGIGEIGFTDHYDLHPDESPRDWLDLERWAEELDRCREKFRGRLAIRAGIEIGEPHLFVEPVRDMLARYPFDYAIGSLHWVGRESIFLPDYFDRSPQAAFGSYFEELERMTRSGEFDILGHLDVPVRTSFDIYGGYDPSPFEPLIRPVLKNCISRGIALEVNTGTLRRSAGVLTPGRSILDWYAEMGGELLTLGSDAHRAEHVGAGLDVALLAASAAGLRYLTMFQRRVPRSVALA